MILSASASLLSGSVRGFGEEPLKSNSVASALISSAAASSPARLGALLTAKI